MHRNLKINVYLFIAFMVVAILPLVISGLLSFLHVKTALKRKLNSQEISSYFSIHKQRYKVGTDYREHKVLSITEAVNDYGWYLIVKVDRDEAMEPVAKMLAQVPWPIMIH